MKNLLVEVHTPATASVVFTKNGRITTVANALKYAFAKMGSSIYDPKYADENWNHLFTMFFDEATLEDIFNGSHKRRYADVNGVMYLDLGNERYMRVVRVQLAAYTFVVEGQMLDSDLFPVNGEAMDDCVDTLIEYYLSDRSAPFCWEENKGKAHNIPVLPMVPENGVTCHNDLWDHFRALQGYEEVSLVKYLTYV